MEQTASTSVFGQALRGADERRAPQESAGRSVARREDVSRPAGAAELDRRARQASYEYTGYMMWSVCLFFGGGALLASVDKISGPLCAVVLAALACAVVVQYRARRRLYAALFERALAKGVTEDVARAEAQAAFARMSR